MSTSQEAQQRTGRPSELGRYEIAEGTRILVGQRVDGEVRITDRPFPIEREGRTFHVETGVASFEELAALVGDYLEQARVLGDCPMRSCQVNPGETSRVAEAVS